MCFKHFGFILILSLGGLLRAQQHVWSPPPYTENSIASKFQSGNFLYFMANDGVHGIELWKSDGTEAGTTLVKDLELEMFPNSYHNGEIINATSTHVFFWANTSPDYLQKLWISDGTEEGTFTPSNYLAQPTSRYNTRSIIVNNNLYFISHDIYGGSSLWRSDGTNQGTSHVDSDVLDSFLTQLNGNVVYSKKFGENDYRILSRSPSGTTLELDLDGNFINTTSNRIYFNRYSTTYDFWVNDGSVNGSKLLIPKVNVGKSVSNADKLFCIGESNFKYSAIITAGDTYNTVVLKDELSQVLHLIKVGSNYVFSESIYGVDGRIDKIWVSDGTPEGTYVAIDNAQSFSYFNDSNSFFYTQCDSDGECSLMKYLILEKASEKIKVLSGGNYYSQNMVEHANWGNKFYFSWNDRIHGNELWVSNGSSTGTRMVKDINKSPLKVEVTNYTNLGNFLLLTISNKGFNTGPYLDLWSLNLSNNEPEFLTELVGLSGNPFYSPSKVNTPFNEKFYFQNFGKIWETNGTLSRTASVEEWNSLVKPPADIIGMTKERIFFTGRESSNAYSENLIYATDGVESPEIIPIPSHYEEYINNLLFDDKSLYIFSVIGENKGKLRVSDGTEGGTRMIEEFDVYPGTGFPLGPMIVNNNLLFTQTIDPWEGIDKGWIFDGSELNELNRVIYFPYGDIKVNDHWFFLKGSPHTGFEIWELKSDLSDEFRLSLPKDSDDSYPYIFGHIGDNLFLRINNKDTYILEAGANMLHELDLDLNIQLPFSKAHNGKLYFSNGIYDDYDLWVSDGTLKNTFPISKIQGGEFSGYFNIVDENLYYAKPDINGSSELWKINTSEPIEVNPIEVEPEVPTPKEPEGPPTNPPDLITGIKNEISDVVIYPNPATDKVSIIAKDTDFELSITDPLGRVLGHFKNLSTIEINLPEGIYIVHYKGRSLDFVQRLIIK